MPNERIREVNVKNAIAEAKRLFAEHGVEQTSIGMVAEAAGVTSRSILHYFGTKNGMIEAVLRNILDEIRAQYQSELHSAVYQEKNGLEQFLYITAERLNLSKVHTKQILSLVEIETTLNRAGCTTFVPPFSAFCEDIIAGMRLALHKGIADGSVKASCAAGEDALKIIFFALRGMYLQLAYIYNSPQLDEKYNAREVGKNCLAAVRAMLTMEAGQEK